VHPRGRRGTGKEGGREGGREGDDPLADVAALVVRQLDQEVAGEGGCDDGTHGHGQALGGGGLRGGPGGGGEGGEGECEGVKG